MRAVSQDALGGPQVLKIIEIDAPEPKATEILVRVHAAGVNPVDWKTRASGGMLGHPPFRLGYDVSGVVEKIGLGVTRFAVGDEVFGMGRFPDELGGYAEYVAAPSRHFAYKPHNLDHLQAAAIPLAALTAWQSLHDAAQVKPGERVLIHAAAGGVGHLAVQLAKHLGAEVIGTASSAKHDFLRELGADHVVDYRAAPLTQTVGTVDVILDPLSGQTAADSLALLGPGGRIVHLTRDLDESYFAEAKRLDIKPSVLLVEPDREQIELLAELASKGTLRPTLDKVFPLAEVAEAHRYGETGRATGKIVLRL